MSSSQADHPLHHHPQYASNSLHSPPHLTLLCRQPAIRHKSNNVPRPQMSFPISPCPTLLPLLPRLRSLQFPFSQPCPNSPSQISLPLTFLTPSSLSLGPLHPSESPTITH